MVTMAEIFIVQHAAKRRDRVDPELTEVGGDQAATVAAELAEIGIAALYSSPLRRARETAAPIAAVTGRAVTIDERLRERMEWDGHQPLANFFDDWVRATEDRSYVPLCGDSSFAAADRFRRFLLEHLDDDRRLAVVSHGGVTVDLLRTLAGDEAIDRRLIDDGVPNCRITRIDGLRVTAIATDVSSAATR